MGTERSGGDPNRTHLQSGLWFESSLDESYPAEEHVAELLERLSPAAEALASFVRQAQIDDPETVAVELRVRIESPGETGLTVSPDQLRTLTAMGAELGVEVGFERDEPDA